MSKRHSIVKCAIAILMGLGLIAAVGAQDRPVVSTESKLDTAKLDTAKLITLSLTFGDGQWARVTGFEGSEIRIEQNGNALTLTPHVINKRSRIVELKVSRIVRGMEAENRQAVDTFVVGNDPTKLDVGEMSFTVQVKKARIGLPTIQAPRQCCVTDCEGRQICGVCVCTPCGVCMAYNWCDCPAPGPLD